MGLRESSHRVESIVRMEINKSKWFSVIGRLREMNFNAAIRSTSILRVINSYNHRWGCFGETWCTILKHNGLTWLNQQSVSQWWNFYRDLHLQQIYVGSEVFNTGREFTGRKVSTSGPAATNLNRIILRLQGWRHHSITGKFWVTRSSSLQSDHAAFQKLICTKLTSRSLVPFASFVHRPSKVAWTPVLETSTE